MNFEEDESQLDGVYEIVIKRREEERTIYVGVNGCDEKNMMTDN